MSIKFSLEKKGLGIWDPELDVPRSKNGGGDMITWGFKKRKMLLWDEGMKLILKSIKYLSNYNKRRIKRAINYWLKEENDD